jgi:serine/threonine protein kinase
VNADPLIGRELAGYRIEELIGKGGMGVVYRAEHVMLGRHDALKLLAADLTADQAFRERFLRESRVAATIEHSNVIPIYHAGEADGLLYLAMRYVRGSDLSKLLKERDRLEPGETVSVIEQVSSALDAAHERGLIHRDVKPANILIEANGHVYLTDFGIAKHTRTRGGLTKTGSFLGTLDYAAPEQIEGKPVDGRVDVYALGCVLYQCLTGAAPYEKDSEVQLIYAHLLERAPPITTRHPGLPPGLDGVLEKALAKSRDDRYATCGQLVADLRTALAGATAPKPPDNVEAPTRIAVPPRPEPTPAAIEVPPRAEPPPAAPPAGPPRAEPPRRPAPPPTPPGRAVPAWRRLPVLLAAGAAIVGAIVAAVLLSGGSSNAFPNTAEKSLLGLVPSAIRSTCSRLTAPASATAAVSCTSGPQQAAYYRFSSARGATRYYRTKLHVAYQRDWGSCSALPRVGERPYSIGGSKAAGHVFCALDPSGPATIGWTNTRAKTFVQATRQDGGQAALYRWWARSAGPLQSAGAKSIPVKATSVPSGAVLYRDTFSSISSGWLRANDTKRRMEYAAGSYRILVKLRSQARVSPLPSLVFGDAEVQVDAAWIAKPSVSSFGLVCRQRSDRYYRLEVFSNGLATISKDVGTKVTQIGPTKNFGRRVLNGTNHLNATCTGGNGNSVQLALTVNGKTFRTTDKKPLASNGAVGMIVSSGSKGHAEARFDNFIVQQR